MVECSQVQERMRRPQDLGVLASRLAMFRDRATKSIVKRTSANGCRMAPIEVVWLVTHFAGQNGRI